MRFIKFSIIPIVVGVAFYLGVHSNDNHHNSKVKKVKKISSKLPETMFVSELTSMRTSKNGIPNFPLIIGDKVKILKEDSNWVEISNSKHTGWIEKTAISKEKTSDTDILEVVKVPNKNVSEDNKDQVSETSESIRKIYNLGNVQFKPIHKKNYKSNPQIKSKAIYMSLNGMYHLDDYIKLAKKSNINTFIFDIKDSNGRTLFESNIAKQELKDNYIRPRCKDIKDVMKKLKDNHIFVIGRISTFKDESFAKTHKDNVIFDKRHSRAYKSSDKVSWLTAFDRRNWYYNVELAKEAANLGFNEILFDYVRFPDRVQNLDKNNELSYKNSYNETKTEAIQRFLKYAHDELSKQEVYISASIFGQVGLSKGSENIGQHWESISNIVDYVNPMAYPSHYSPGTFGLKIPDNNPYKLMSEYAKKVKSRNKNLSEPAIVETWIQGFTAPWIKGHITYKAHEIKEQIRALKEEGFDDYLVWNASSRYDWKGFDGK